MTSRSLAGGRASLAGLALMLSCAIIFACSGSPSRAQTDAGIIKEVEEMDPDIQGVNEFIDTFQERYSAMDYEGVSELFMKGGAVVVDYEGKIRTYSTREWLSMTEIFRKNTSQITDRLTEREIDVYRNIAVVQCRYDFSSPVEQSTGHDIFSLVRSGNKWLIVSLMYSGDKKSPGSE